jgi:hypothetical protein
VATPQVLSGNEQLVAYHTTYAYDGEGNTVTQTDNNGNATPDPVYLQRFAQAPDRSDQQRHRNALRR